jgi:ABC-type sugar transport system ATPase subunit
MAADVKLALNDVSKGFPGVQALDSVSFEIKSGHLHALVGENGAGKSTLIKILSAAIQRDSGHMLLDGTPYNPRNPRDAFAAGISTIYQESNLLLTRSVMSNIMLGKEPRRIPGVVDYNVMRLKTEEILATLKAEHIDVTTLVEELKVSEKQLVEIARALLNEATLFIMDEPTAALNRQEVNALFEVIAVLKARGATILYVSHRLEEIFQLADEVTVLRDGAHIRTAPISEVTADSLITDMIGRRLDAVFPERNTSPGEEVLSVNGLSTSVFTNVSFSLRAGEVLAITGVGGSGKTELGKALFGDHPIRAGQITVNGEALRANPSSAIAAGVICVPEDRKIEGVIQNLDVKRNISLAMLGRVARLGVINRAEERAVAEAQVRDLDIKTPSLAQEVGNLSGGNQQKVALGKWLAAGARIFILMEPTQGIDVGVKFEVYELVARLSREGAAVILISSELPEVLGLAHRVLVMRNGALAAELDGFTTDAEEILRHALGADK